MADRPYAGNLYSVEFFQMCARRLRPGGLVTTWLPSPRVRATFLSAFPHVVEISGGKVAMGSPSPIPIDPRPGGRASSTPATPRTWDGRAAAVWADLKRVQPVERTPAPTGPINRDLFPRDEFNTPD